MGRERERGKKGEIAPVEEARWKMDKVEKKEEEERETRARRDADEGGSKKANGMRNFHGNGGGRGKRERERGREREEGGKRCKKINLRNVK